MLWHSGLSESLCALRHWAHSPDAPGLNPRGHAVSLGGGQTVLTKREGGGLQSFGDLPPQSLLCSQPDFQLKHTSPAVEYFKIT